MHFKLTFLLFSVLLVQSSKAQQPPSNTTEFIQYLKSYNGNKVCNTYTFEQQTITYKVGKADTATWFETVTHPDYFRIDFNKPLSGNHDVYVKDTLYAFRNGVLKATVYKPHEFLLFEGGIYHLTIDSILNKLPKMGIDRNLFTLQIQDSQTFGIIGANNTNMTTAQVWIDIESGLVKKLIGKLGNGKMYEAVVTEHTKVGNYTFPKTITFNIDGKLIQKEQYYNINPAPQIPSDFFNVTTLCKNHWKTKH